MPQQETCSNQLDDDNKENSIKTANWIVFSWSEKKDETGGTIQKSITKFELKPEDVGFCNDFL